MEYRILKNYPNIDGWQEGDIVEITDATVLIEQGLVEPADARPISDGEPEIVSVEDDALTPTLSWKKEELVSYAKGIGVKSSGTKKQILDEINKNK